MTKKTGSILVICTFPEDEKMYPHLYDVLQILKKHFDDVIYVGSDPRFHPLLEIDEASARLNSTVDERKRYEIQAHIAKLARRYKITRHELIDTLRRVPFKSVDRLVLAIDDHAFNCAMEVFPEHTAYWSFDVLALDCPYRLPNTDCIAAMLKENGKMAEKSRALIIQDSSRKELLEEALGARFRSAISLPVALSDTIFCKKASIVRRQQGALQRLKIVQSGHVCDSRFSRGLVQAFQDWPQNCELHLRGYIGYDVLQQVCQGSRTVFVSDEFYDNSVLDKLFNTFDVGFIGYKETDRNHLLIVNASSQLVAYLRLGIPVIYCGSGQLLPFVAKHRIGISSERPGDISPEQLDFLFKNYGELSANARRIYEENYDLEKIMQSDVLPSIEKLLGGSEPESDTLHAERDLISGIGAVDSFYVDLWNDPSWSSPYPNTDEEARWSKISCFLDSYCNAMTWSSSDSKRRILDVGCGRGWLSALFGKYGEYIGIEPVAGAVEIAKSHFPGRTFYSCYTSDLIQQQAGVFDLIVSTEVIEHVPYPRQKSFVSDLYALLADNGLLVLTTPRKEIYDYILAHGLCPQPIEDWLTEDELENLLRSQGFSVYGRERIFYDALTGRFHLSPTDTEITAFGLIALYQVWAVTKIILQPDRWAARDNVVSPLVSVIVPTYNRPDMLKFAIQSILTQTFQDFEIIVVNDAGADVADVIAGFASEKISYLRHATNKGLATARNTGINAARGTYIAYLDDDDRYYPDHLETLVQHLEATSHQVAYTEANRIWQEWCDGEWIEISRDVPYSYDFDRDEILVDNCTPVLCVMHRKDCLDAVGMFDETLKRHEDWEMWIRLSRHYQFDHIRRVTCAFSHRLNGSTMTGGNPFHFLASYRQVCHKHTACAEGKPWILRQQKQVEWNFIYAGYEYVEQQTVPLLTVEADAAGLLLQSFQDNGIAKAQIAAAACRMSAMLVVGNDQKKMQLLREALQHDQEYLAARLELVRLLLQHRQLTEACGHLELLLALKPDDPDLCGALADCRCALAGQVQKGNGP